MAHAKDLDYDKVAKAALDCEGRFEFQQRYKSEYNWANNPSNGTSLDEVCAHMETQRISKWTFDLLLEKNKLQPHKTISPFIISGASKWNALSEEDQNKVRAYYGNHRDKAVIQYTEDNKYIATHTSAKTAAEAIGKPKGNSEINSAAQGKRELKRIENGYNWAYGFRWERA
jgi:hypothetical protein